MCLKRGNPLRDLWEGASLEGRELPWTRKERKREREERKKEVRGRTVVLSRRDAPARLCDVLNERYIQSIGPNLQAKDIRERERSSRRARSARRWRDR